MAAVIRYEKPFCAWPSWRWHADFPDGRIFEREEDVPADAVDHPSKIKATPAMLAKKLNARKGAER